MGLEVREPQSVPSRKRVEQLVVLANARGNLVDKIDVVRVPHDQMVDDERDRVTDHQARRAVDVRPKFSQQCENGLRANRVHELPRQKLKTAIIVGGGLRNRSDYFAAGIVREPGTQSLRTPMLLQGCEAVTNEQPGPRVEFG
jgi:hypothetical protein